MFAGGIAFKMFIDNLLIAFPSKPFGSSQTHTATNIEANNISTQANTIQERPFEMPLSGDRWSIFQPLYDMDEGSKIPQLFASSDKFVTVLKERMNFSNAMLSNPPSVTPGFAYLELMKSLVTATAYNNAEASVHPRVHTAMLSTSTFDLKKGKGGKIGHI